MVAVMFGIESRKYRPASKQAQDSQPFAVADLRYTLVVCLIVSGGARGSSRERSSSEAHLAAAFGDRAAIQA